MFSGRLRSHLAALASRMTGTGCELLISYACLLGTLAYLGHWSPDYLAGRSLWHFTISRMIIPLIALAALASWARLIPSALLLTSFLLAIGTVSAIKREALGEPFQTSDILLAGQGPALFGYVSWSQWLVALAVLIAAAIYLWNARVRVWSFPVFAICVALLVSCRSEAVMTFVHDYLPPWGIENLPFDQAASERMNGLATHLYLSGAGVRLSHFSRDEMAAALARLDPEDVQTAAGGRRPDIYIVLGEAWWRDPSDKRSPLDDLLRAGFFEGTAVSPVYGGTTPNAEFEVLTGVPAHTFSTAIVPYQHYFRYFTAPRTLPRLLSPLGYSAHAYHNHNRAFWLRDRVYPRFGFDTFEAAETMKLVKQANGWAKDDVLYEAVRKKELAANPEFGFLVTVATHGPYEDDPEFDPPTAKGAGDYRRRLGDAVRALLDFERQLRQRGRPFVLIVFGDHLPGMPAYQRDIGLAEGDPRLHRVPVLLAGTEPNLDRLRDDLDGRPLFCMAPVLVSWARLGVEDVYFRDVAKHCRERNQSIVVTEPIIQHQLFSPLADQIESLGAYQPASDNLHH
jgi:phosphoglycerol transferase MdoB-like AlkP superfamily enzyme